MKHDFIILLLLILYYVYCAIPNWDIASQSIDIMSSTNTYEYILYQKTAYELKVTLTKKITKTDSIITSQNYITVYKNSVYQGLNYVEFEDIDSHYANKLGIEILICPKGKFQPYDFKNNEYLEKPGGFNDNGGWDLRCYDHSVGYFYIFYLLNNGKNFYYKYNGNINGRDDYIYSYFYDYKLENGNEDNKEYKFCVLRYDGANGGVIRLVPDSLKVNKGNGNVDKVSKGSVNDINTAKQYTQAYFDNNHYFYYFTYNDASDFESGYSTNYINFSSDTVYASSASNPGVVKKTDTPLTFVDNVEIQKMQLISGTKYAYYKIFNKDKYTYYYGLIDLTQGKILYNFDKEITSFIPDLHSGTFQMLALTSTTAYKVCIIKSGDSCIEACSGSGNNLILDSKGNKCQSGCDSGKVKLMPEGICIQKEECDTNIYVFNTGETECGLCKYINSDNNKKYKFINTEECINHDSIPENSEFYNENSYLLKCIENYHLDNNRCLPDSCYERCDSCSQVSSDINDQKCLTCKNGFNFENGNCVVPPTTVLTSPPSTILTNRPTTVLTSPVTTILTNIPITIETKVPTTVIEETPSTQIHETEYVENCSNERCLKCSTESNKLKLCISCDETKYKKVNYTSKFSSYYDCIEKEKLETRYYYDNKNEQYKPCFKLCKKCLGPGNATDNNCLECADNYMFRPGPNPKNNCVVYSEYYYISSYNEYKPLLSPQCPEEAKYRLIDENNKTSCRYDCKMDETYKYLYNGNCLKQCPEGTTNSNYICKENDPNKVYISENPFYSDSNQTIESIEVLAMAFAEEYSYTDNHIASFSNDEYGLLLYKNPRILNTAKLKTTDIDFGQCYEDVKKAYNITTNLITAVGEVKNSDNNNPSNFYLFFHPKTGAKLDAGPICQNKSIEMKVPILDEKAENYELKSALTDQGINIYDINDPYYKDICYDFDNPKNKDMALKDRIKETYVDIQLCDEGCINTGVDLKNNVATCDCKFNDITNNDIVHENAALDFLVGELFDIVNSSNILVLKCYKNLLKYFTRSMGGIIILSLFSLSIICTAVFFSCDLNKMKRYIYTLTKKYISFISNYSHNIKFFPPRKKTLRKRTTKASETKIPIEEKNNNINPKNQKPKNKKNQPHNKNISNTINTSSKLDVKENSSEEGDSNYLDTDKKIKKYFKDYLSTSPDDMEFDDAIKKDKRAFCAYFCDIIKQKQSLAYTFISSDKINTRMIKLILFCLNITLYFVVNGLFFSEAYISELYHLNDDHENFFSFIPRTIDKVLYTTLVSVVIGYMTDFFFIDEKKIKGIFKRDKDNSVILKRSILTLFNEIKKRYISFIIMTFVIFIISLYYILCFNYVYPKTQMEWIKSSVLIIIIMQILSILKCAYQAVIRFLSFSCESEKLYKVSKIFENNS